MLLHITMYLLLCEYTCSVCICVYTLQAAQSGALETVHWLLEAGCPVNVCDGKYVCRFLYHVLIVAICGYAHSIYIHIYAYIYIYIYIRLCMH